MEPNLLQAISGLAGVAVGVLGTFLGSVYTARQETKKIRLTYSQQLIENERSYRQKLDENHIANA